MKKTKILLVDDEKNVLQGYKRNLYNFFDVTAKESAIDALDIIKKGNKFPVIISDMKMPGMDGAEFLSNVKDISPNSVRLLLTGQSNMDQTIKAINEGQIFRFLTKPISTSHFKTAILDAAKQYNLLLAEKVLLEKTLRGTIKLLVDILSNSFPEAFEKTNRIKSIIHQIFDNKKLKTNWETEASILLSQIGVVTLPPDMVEKKFNGVMLIKNELSIFSQHPNLASKMLSKIPRLDNVSKNIKYIEKTYDGGGLPKDSLKGTEIPIISRLIKVVSDFDDILFSGYSKQYAITKLKKFRNKYDPILLKTLSDTIRPESNVKIISKTIATDFLQVGMTITENIHDLKSGLLLIPKMHQVTNISKAKIDNYLTNGNMPSYLKVIDYQKK